MKKLLSIFLAFTFTLNVFAASSASMQFERSLNEYQYAITVEWDQKDQKFYDDQTQSFLKKMSELIQEKGLKQEEVLVIAEKKVGNKQTLEAMKLKLALVGNAKNPAEFSAMIKEISKGMYSTGASWNGEFITENLLLIFMLVTVGALIYIGVTQPERECVAWEQRWECHGDTDCFDTISGSVRCNTDTYCGWDDYCTQYVEVNKNP